MTTLPLPTTRTPAPTNADHTLADRIADFVAVHGLPRITTNGQLDDGAREAAMDVANGIQALHNAQRQAVARIRAAQGLPDRLAAELDRWRAIDHAGADLAGAIARLRARDVDLSARRGPIPSNVTRRMRVSLNW